MKIRRTYRLTAGFLAIVMLLTTVAVTENCAVMNMHLNTHSYSSIMKNHMMAHHECCNDVMNISDQDLSSNLLNFNADWCSCQIAQPAQTNRLTIVNTPFQIHYYPVVISAIEPVIEKFERQPFNGLENGYGFKVPLFVQNLSLLD